MNGKPGNARYERASSHEGNSGRQQFDGFPYLVTRIVPGLYDVIVLPADVNEAGLIAYSETQTGLNKLEACLVLGDDQGVWFAPHGTRSYSRRTPSGGNLITGALKTFRDMEPSPEREERANRLDVLVQGAIRRGGYLHGGWTHGGRPATDQELEKLSGRGPEGAPTGLSKCTKCGGWAGECLGTAVR